MQHPQLMPFPDPDWLELVRAEIGKGRSIAEVAREIGMPRPSLSMLLAGKYPARMDKKSRKFASRVFELYRDQVFCPHLREGISGETCRLHASAPMSTSHPDRLSHWRACRGCALNPISPPAVPAANTPARNQK